ncbi:hypothetical protein SK355_06570 [Candidatus Fukatsuia symbiotica]|nr:hypothetical protein [Candidatus Fukatsuia symbiotica]MEA9444941.1 hypothetical protein [Candidatus Fukatsuia symbiotica]
MKWIPATVSFIGLILAQAIMPLPVFSTNELPTIKRRENVQIGFYDLLSQKKEIYDAKITVNKGVVISTMTSPNDNRFILKGKLVQKPLPGRQLQYKYTPIFHHNPTSGHMVDGLIDYLVHNRIIITPIWVNGQYLVFGQGGIFLEGS